MNRRCPTRFAVSWLLALAFFAGVRAADGGDAPDAKGGAEDAAPASLSCVGEFRDGFDGGRLDESKWAVTRLNDFSEFSVDVAQAPDGGGRLRLRCATMKTDDKTVKALGVASLAPLDLSGEKRLSFELDWNEQFNGCYLTGAVYLCPTLTRGPVGDEPRWLKIEYVGVPPGKNARAAIWLRKAGAPRWIYDEGWPARQRTGRKIDKVRVEILFKNGAFTVTEDGRRLFASSPKDKLPFEKAHVYFQMTSHSNYPAREIYFDDVAFGEYSTD